MRTILRSQLAPLLELFLEHRGATFHVRELMQKAKVSAYTIEKYVNLLVQEGVLLEKRERHLRLLTLNYHNNTTKAVATYYHQEFLATLPENISSALEELSETHDNQLIILYGSYAKGTPTSDSDVDVLIYVKNMPRKLLDTKSINHKYQVRINLAVTDTLQKTSTQHILQTGIPVNNHTRFYEEYGKTN